MADQVSIRPSPKKAGTEQNQGFTYITEMVAKPTWKEILLELIDSNKVDPWNIDLVEISNAFLAKVREMERMDFAVQANVILAAAILLRYKSNYLSSLQQAELTEYMPEELPLDIGEVDSLPQLTLSSRIPPKRQITLDELVTEMERIIRYDDENRVVRKPRGAIVDTVDFELEEQDIEKMMGEVFVKVKKNTDKEGWSMFSGLLEKKEKGELVYTLLSILHLTQTKKIDIKQDKMFGEIFIKLLDKG